MNTCLHHQADLTHFTLGDDKAQAFLYIFSAMFNFPQNLVTAKHTNFALMIVNSFAKISAVISRQKQ